MHDLSETFRDFFNHIPPCRVRVEKNLCNNPLYQAQLLEDQSIGPCASLQTIRTKEERFWNVLFDRVIKLDPAIHDDKVSQEEQAFYQHFSDALQEYRRWSKVMKKTGFEEFIGVSKTKGVANFFGGLHRTCYEDSCKLFYYAMTLPWKDEGPTPWLLDGHKRKMKLLDIGFGHGFNMVLAILLGFKCVALDIPEG